ncbi:uncharacterized protein LOC142345502 [Convolutriloba macropyga]|uniref:uncharacterized protein LOC142345502 n=1 Tax=Convolutriloba macropyga TaxID=536237 RepID=UPI003F51D320
MIRAMYISALLAIAAVFGAVYTTCPGSSSLVTGITDRCFEVVSQKQKFFQGLKECEGKPNGTLFHPNSLDEVERIEKHFKLQKGLHYNVGYASIRMRLKGTDYTLKKAYWGSISSAYKYAPMDVSMLTTTGNEFCVVGFPEGLKGDTHPYVYDYNCSKLVTSVCEMPVS